jgi:hypothetical protein
LHPHGAHNRIGEPTMSVKAKGLSRKDLVVQR